ncbi:arginine decarboxylase, partial [Bacillus safensis]
TIDTLVTAMQEIAAASTRESGKQAVTEVLLPEIPSLAMTPRDAFYATTEVVPFKEAVGRIIAEFVMVYPPGIPIFIPGEIITEENISYIFKNIEIGLPVQGPEDSTLEMIRVIKEQKPIL